MINIPASADINSLFANSNPDLVWVRASGIIRRINPSFNPTFVRNVFDDVMRVFHGEYPGYGSIKTLYHDLPHTLDVFICAVRLMHGVHLSGTRLTDREITLILIATLMHDIGYSQLDSERGGTGAQYTQTHVKRGIAFMKKYFTERGLPMSVADILAPMISTTDPSLNFNEINFPDERIRMLGQIVVTADLTGQMADRTYLEKLLFLYLEFKEAHFGNYRNTYDLLRQTQSFYGMTREKLDGVFGGIYNSLNCHFRDIMGVENNYYLEAIEKNMAYLSKVVEQSEAEYLRMLKRGGIVEKSRTMLAA